MHTSAPDAARRRVTAPPMPRDPPVITARRPLRLNGELEEVRALLRLAATSAPRDFVIDHLANRMLDVQLDLLCAIGAIGRHDDAVIHEGRERTATFRAERQCRDSLLLRGVGG